ncbi:MAG: secondary thiamine-phosphate synthase enzyme YjbQ [Thaumarchaeota archaeon]|jgi:secondary thiamine-phosphate synthase enzyme|nr:secondary thiamine-phosphate synthase enzyme YjbQ [Candidatus Terraquivivens yellowstonensis]MCL7388126.1 secondary thiamine-phosphate synthase enzyme YjbQ [Candidatus Terraquivivens yellowstonensis]MCL7392773.1 secondary thiamine-phosphate synthase enzyme YjbQ [Candidatus Terraquivivens yellowstonensis]MCL7395702.1 secondary thiamine-phosphate synthase enzyme YjbQ [Candidatus Terraquivivens yellowstonensis]MCL7397572.1 secondary thiamine-phosphate synthase enzyme YjbQ [Candidatus Terraquivi
MGVWMGELSIKTKGEGDVVNITDMVSSATRSSGISNGIVNVFVVGSTAAVTTIEYEPGLVRDISDILERVAPKNHPYKHHERWGDYNGHSHVRAALIGPSISVPLRDGRLVLGTWQQLVLLELDTRARERKVVLTIVGE